VVKAAATVVGGAPQLIAIILVIVAVVAVIIAVIMN